MENKIQELTDKIYREGVEKGNEEAQRLISSARDEAAKIVEDVIGKGILRIKGVFMKDILSP